MRTTVRLLRYAAGAALRDKAKHVRREQQKLLKTAKLLRSTDPYSKQADNLTGQAYALNNLAEQYNREAAAATFQSFNKNYPSTDIDLHGLTISEARYYLGEHLKYLVRINQGFFNVTVGRGNNSESGPVLGNTIYEFAKAHDIYCTETYPGNWVLNMTKSFNDDLDKPTNLFIF